MNFDVVGPFELSRYGSTRLITKQSLKNLLPVLEVREEGLSEACGCYVFAIRAGPGYTPYYVGQACRSSIPREALNPSNLMKYNELLGKTQGTPVLFLIPMRTPSGKFRRKREADGSIDFLDFLERWLIAAAIEKNPDLINNRETKFLRDLYVTGIFNAKQGGLTIDAQELKRTLW